MKNIGKILTVVLTTTVVASFPAMARNNHRNTNIQGQGQIQGQIQGQGQGQQQSNAVTIGGSYGLSALNGGCAFGITAAKPVGGAGISFPVKRCQERQALTAAINSPYPDIAHEAWAIMKQEMGKRIVVAPAVAKTSVIKGLQSCRKDAAGRILVKRARGVSDGTYEAGKAACVNMLQ